MQIFQSKSSLVCLYQRSISLLISKEFADQRYGKVQVLAQQDSEQENRRRELLDIEVKVQQEKIIADRGAQHFRQQVTTNFFNQVRSQVNNEFDNQEYLYHQVLGIEDAAPAILDILSKRAASVNQIKPLASALSWLAADLINLINKPQYRKRADVEVTDAKLAISYIGLDNLKVVMPTFILKHWLPASTAPFGLMKRKLWNNSLSIALAASALAKEQGEDTFAAFSTGMLSTIGQLALTRCFLRTFSDMHTKKLQNAHDAKDKRLHNIILQITDPSELLFEQLLMRSSNLSAELVEKMHFERLKITEPMFDLAYSESLKKMCPIAQIVTKATAYVTFRSLAKDALINASETKNLFATVALTASEISLLKKTDIDHIKLNFS